MDDQIKEVVKNCTEIGFSCTDHQAEEALKPGRGEDNVEMAVYWLTCEDGFNVLARKRPISLLDDSDDDSDDDEKKDSITSNQDTPQGAIDEVISMCKSIGISCNAEQAREALKSHRGRGDPETAVFWLTKDGFQVLARLKQKVTSAFADEFLSSTDEEMTDPKSLEACLVQFTKDNGIDPDIARAAAHRCSSITAGCEWILENHNTKIDTGKENANLGFKNGFNDQYKSVHCTLTQVAERSRGCWTCSSCTFVNSDPGSGCECCGDPGPFYEQKLKYEQELASASILAPPEYWDPFPPGKTYVEVELINAKGPASEERDRMINIFKKGGVNARNIISLKRIQNLPMWQRFAAQCDIVATKPSNNGYPNVKYLFHGPKGNTDAILKNGFLGQCGKSQPYGTWTHTSSQYSGGNFADTNPPDGGRRIFICKAAIGTPGMDDGSGRCPNQVMQGVLADCHQNGGIHVFYVDSQLYAEYLIHWR